MKENLKRLSFCLLLGVDMEYIRYLKNEKLRWIFKNVQEMTLENIGACIAKKYFT